MQLKRILFPVDFSDSSAAVASDVEAMVRGCGARLTLLHVLEYPPPWYSDTDAVRLSSGTELAFIRECRQEQLDHYLRRQLDHLRPSRVLVQGDAPAEIVRYSLNEGISLIMMPTRGAGVFRRLLLGSVAAKVLRDSSCPVWTTSHSEHVVSARYPYRMVACAIDLSYGSAELLQWASQFASHQHAAIRVVHAIDVDEVSTNRGVVAVRRYLREAALGKWEQIKEKEGLAGSLCFAYGSTGPALRKAAHDLQADVLIIGRGHTQQTLGRLRTTSYDVIRESPCPIISV